MRRFLASLVFVVCISVANPAMAAAKEFDGQGFDCYFQTGIQKLDRLSVWYGGLRYANDKSPQFQDSAKLVVLQDFVEGARMTFYVSDKWPDTFEFQYFDKSSTSPLSVLTIHGDASSAGVFRAEIAHLPPNLSVGVSVQPRKRISGMCSYTEAVTWAAFRTKTQS